MIGYGIFLGDNMCHVEKKHVYAICYGKEYAKEYARRLSEARKGEYVSKKVNIEVLE